MREVVLRVPAHALDEILDRLLPLVPDGVRETPVGDRDVELRMRGELLPPTDEIWRCRRPRN